MKIAIIGSRNFNDYELLKQILNQYQITEIISGGAKGADSLAEKYAIENKIKTTIFYPNWQQFGKSAGFIRNKDIVLNCEMIIAFWNGESKGTKHSIDLAKKNNKKIKIIYFNNEKNK